jgi:serine acetyltransferase
MLLSDPARLWQLSARLWQQGKRRRARLIKGYNFLVFRAVLPPEAILEGSVWLGHYGMNIVVHPNVTIGHEVMLWHGITLSVSATPGSDTRLVIGDRVMIGTGSVIITPHKSSMQICDDVAIGANSVVSHSIDRPGSYGGIPARLIGKPNEELIL